MVLRQRRGFRVLGIDDGPFTRGQQERVLIVGPILRGTGQLDGLVSSTVERDGFDATERLISMVNGSRFRPQLQYLMLSGITFGGFNVVDLPALREQTSLKVVAVTRRPPNISRMLSAVEALPDPRRRRELILRAGTVLRLHGLCCQLHGLEPEEAEALLEVTCRVGRFPEPLRQAHIIAGGVVLGESAPNRA